MDKDKIIKIIREKFDNTFKVKVPLLKGNRFFLAELVEDGINVSNLGNNPFLSWDVFTESVNLIERLGGIAKKGDAMLFSLGEKGLDLNTIEGYIAVGTPGEVKKEADELVRELSTPDGGFICEIVKWNACHYSE